MVSNVVTAAFGASRTARTRALHQWDYGQILQLLGLNLPDAYTVHFSNVGVGGTAKTQVGNADGVDIPDEYLITGQPVYAWVYLHTGADDGETVYSVVIPVTARPQPTEEEPTPVQQGMIDQAIAALNAGVEAAEGAAQDAEQIATDLGDFETAIAAATAAKEAAEQSADDAAGSASAAGTAQAAAEEASDEAASARDAAVAAQGSAESSAQAAAGSATAAAGSAEAAAASETAAREVKESIPQDYTALSENVSELKSQVGNVAELTTNNKTSTTDAINEIAAVVYEQSESVLSIWTQ